MKQTKTTLKELTARYRAVLLKCALINLMLCSAAGAASISDTTDGTNRYIGSFGVPLKVYDNVNGVGSFYAVASDLMEDATINGVTATLNNASRVGSGNLSWTQSTGKYAEVSNPLSDSQKTSSVNNIATVLTAMNKGNKNYDALPDGIKQALNVPFDGGQSIAEYLQTVWGASGSADISEVRAALATAYATFDSNMTTPFDKAVSVTNSTLTLNGTSAIVNRSAYSPASDGNIAINNSTINVGGTNALIAHTGIAFTGNSNLNVSQGATLTVTSSGNLVSLTDSNLTLNGTITGNVSFAGTGMLQGTGSISGNLNAAALSVLKMKNSAIDTITAGTVTGGNFSITLDVNAASGTIDHINATTFTTGTITISDLNFISAEQNFALNVLNGNATGATLVLSSAVSSAYNTGGSVEEWRNNLTPAATWATAFTRTRYTIETSKTLTVQNNKMLVFTIVNGAETQHETESLGDTLQLLNTMGVASRTMTNSTSAASYTVTGNLGETAAGTFTINGAKADSSAATINLASHTGFSVGSDATLNLQNIIFSNNTGDAGSVLTVAGGTAGLSNVTIGNTVSVTSGTLTLSGGNSLGGLANAGTVALTGANSIGAMSGAGTLTNNGNLILTGTTNAQIIGGTGRTYVNAALETTAAINQAITINSGKTLTALAGNIGGAVTNNGTLALTGGTLGQAVSGGAVQINGNVESSVALSNVTISSGNKLTIGAGNIGTGLTNNGTLALSGGTLTRTVSGTVHIDGNVTSNVSLSNTTINSGNQLTIGAGNVGSGLTIANEGTLVLTAGTLGDALSGEGEVQINGNVISNVDLANVTINSGRKLTINAGYVGDGEFTNNGTLALSGGTLGYAVSGAIQIAGDVTSNVSLANTTINSGKKLTIDAGNVGGNMRNHGTLVLRDGTLNNTLSGEGSVQINGNVISNVGLTNVIINSGKKLTISADYVDNTYTNNGTIALSGGTLSILTTGTLEIAGDVISNVLMSNTTISDGNKLTISANNVGTGLTNSGTLILTGGTLRREFTGAGNVQINGDVISNVNMANVTINDGNMLTIDADYIGAGEFTNNGILALSGGTLGVAVSGTGSIQIAGNVISSVLLANTTINSGKTLTIAAGNIGENLTNNGILALSSGTLTRTVSGTIHIDGDVESNVSLANTTITSGNKLTIAAGNIGENLTNNGTLALSGGTLTKAVTGTLQIAGDVTSNVSLANTTTTINSGKTLTIAAGNIGANLTNNGILALSGGTLTRTVSGTVHIDGDVVSEVDLANVTINSGKKLTINAGYADGSFTNNGILALSGGTLTSTVGGTGTVQIDGNVISNVALSNVTINNGKKLTIGAGNIGAGLTNNGVLALTNGTLGTAVSGTVHIDGDVTSNVVLSNTTINSGKKLTIAAGNIGENLTNNGTLALSGGTLETAVSGTGIYQIAGNVVSEVALSNVTINSGKKLTINAGYVDNTFTNNGMLALSGGTLETAVSGTIEIDGTVVSGVSLSNTTINGTKSLRIAAENVGTGMTNNGTLILTDGTLSKTLSGTGTVQIDGDVVSNVDLANVTIHSDRKLTINANYIGEGEFTNNGTLALSGGTLETTVAGTGTVQINGDVVSLVTLGNTTVNSAGRLMLYAYAVGTNVTNNGKLFLYDGTLGNAVAGNGETEIIGNIVSNVSLSKTTIDEDASLTIGAGNVGTNLTNNGTLVLTDGALGNALSGTGAVQINGTVTSSVSLLNTTINNEKQLTISAGNVGANLTNNGTLVLTNGTLSNALSGSGVVQIDGDVASSVNLENVTINENKKLTINAGYVDNTFTNNGTLALSGGTLDVSVAGTVQIVGDVTSNVSLANTTITSGNKLTISADNIGANLTNNGTLALSSGTIASALSGTGAVQIAGDVISNVLLSNATINSGKKLTIAADNVGTGLTNKGTLALSGGTLTKTVSGTVQINGNVISQVSLANTTITSGNTLTIAAGNIGENLANNGILAVSGGRLTKAVSGTGTIQIDGNVISDVLLANATVNNTKQLTIGAGNVGAGLTNNGTLVLTDGTLDNALSGNGAVQINGDVVSNVDLANVTINGGKKLTIDAYYIGDGEFTNNGTLALSGGALFNTVTGSGTVQIDGDVLSLVALEKAMVSSAGELWFVSAADVGEGIVNNGRVVLYEGELNNAIAGGGETGIVGEVVSNVSLSKTMIFDGGQLTIGAGNIGAEMTNDGNLVLTSGTLSHTVRGAGTVQIDGNVVSETALSNVTVNADKTLTLSSAYVGSGFTNNGTVVLTGGEISNPLSGNITMTGLTEMTSGADFSGAQIDLTEGTLYIGENTLTSNTLTGGTVSLDLKEYAAAETLITTTPSGSVTLEVWPFEVTGRAVQHYTLTSTDNGYSIEFILPQFYAISTTPFVKDDAMTIGEFDAASWTGGDLYIVSLNIAEISVSELAKNGYEVTANDKNTTKKLSDDLEDVLTGQYQDNYQKVNLELIYGFLDEDYGRVKTILNESGTEATPATSQTVQANAQAVMSVVSSRMDGAPVPASVKGRSGGDFVSGNSTVWAQGMFNKAKLNGANGFNSDSTGFAAGFEYDIDDSYKVGAGYAFASTDIKTDRSKTTVDTHTAFVYGTYKPDAFYVNGVLSYGRSSYDEKTKLLGLQSDYKADVISLQAMSGYALENFTPEAGLRYTNVAEKAYTDALGARIKGKTLQTWTAVAGVSAAKEFSLEKGGLSAQAKAALTYDLKQSGINKTVSMANGTSYVVRGENMKRFGLEFGAGVSYKLNRNTDIGLSYEGKFKKDYTDHTGLINVRYSF